MPDPGQNAEALFDQIVGTGKDVAQRAQQAAPVQQLKSAAEHQFDQLVGLAPKAEQLIEPTLSPAPAPEPAKIPWYKSLAQGIERGPYGNLGTKLADKILGQRPEIDGIPATYAGSTPGQSLEQDWQQAQKANPKMAGAGQMLSSAAPMGLLAEGGALAGGALGGAAGGTLGPVGGVVGQTLGKVAGGVLGGGAGLAGNIAAENEGSPAQRSAAVKQFAHEHPVAASLPAVAPLVAESVLPAAADAAAPLSQYLKERGNIGLARTAYAPADIGRLIGKGGTKELARAGQAVRDAGLNKPNNWLQKITPTDPARIVENAHAVTSANAHMPLEEQILQAPVKGGGSFGQTGVDTAPIHSALEAQANRFRGSAEVDAPKMVQAVERQKAKFPPPAPPKPTLPTPPTGLNVPPQSPQQMPLPLPEPQPEQMGLPLATQTELLSAPPPVAPQAPGPGPLPTVQGQLPLATQLQLPNPPTPQAVPPAPGPMPTVQGEFPLPPPAPLEHGSLPSTIKKGPIGAPPAPNFKAPTPAQLPVVPPSPALPSEGQPQLALPSYQPELPGTAPTPPAAPPPMPPAPIRGPQLQVPGTQQPKLPGVPLNLVPPPAGPPPMPPGAVAGPQLALPPDQLNLPGVPQTPAPKPIPESPNYTLGQAIKDRRAIGQRLFDTKKKGLQPRWGQDAARETAWRALSDAVKDRMDQGAATGQISSQLVGDYRKAMGNFHTAAEVQLSAAKNAARELRRRGGLVGMAELGRDTTPGAMYNLGRLLEKPGGIPGKMQALGSARYGLPAAAETPIQKAQAQLPPGSSQSQIKQKANQDMKEGLMEKWYNRLTK